MSTVIERLKNYFKKKSINGKYENDTHHIENINKEKEIIKKNHIEILKLKSKELKKKKNSQQTKNIRKHLQFGEGHLGKVYR